VVGSPIIVIKFFDQYRALYDDLLALDVGEDRKVPIDAIFPPTHKSTSFGLGLSEEILQQRLSEHTFDLLELVVLVPNDFKL
jgi:hypothetical protein